MSNINPRALYVHCDAAMDYDSKSSGGVGVEIVFPDNINLDPKILSIGRYVGANIERLELEAIVQGMNQVLKIFESHQLILKEIQSIIITTDRISLNDKEKTSPYNIKEWRKNDWKNYENKPIKNSDLLDKIDKLRKKINTQTYCRVNIVYQPRKYHRGVDKLAKEGKKKAQTNKSIAQHGTKIGKRKFDGPEINYSILKAKDVFNIHIYKKEPVGEQWEVCGEFCDSEFMGKTLKIYSTPKIGIKLHRHHIYRVRLKNVFQHHVTIYKTFTEFKKKETKGDKINESL